MAMYYQFIVDCGNDKNVYDRFIKQFHDKIIKTTLEFDIRCASVRMLPEIDEDGNRYCLFHAEGVSVNGFKSLVGAKEGVSFESGDSLSPLSLYTAQASNWFYDQLLVAPPFHHANVGWDVDGRSSRKELLQNDFALGVSSGLIVSEEFYKQLGSLPQFVFFKENYFWIPKDDEDSSIASRISRS